MLDLVELVRLPPWAQASLLRMAAHLAALAEDVHELVVVKHGPVVLGYTLLAIIALLLAGSVALGLFYEWDKDAFRQREEQLQLARDGWRDANDDADLGETSQADWEEAKASVSPLRRRQGHLSSRSPSPPQRATARAASTPSPSPRVVWLPEAVVPSTPSKGAETSKTEIDEQGQGPPSPARPSKAAPPRRTIGAVVAKAVRSLLQSPSKQAPGCSDPNEYSADGLTPFLRACALGDADQAAALLHAGAAASATTRDGHGDSALFLATFACVVKTSVPIALVELLLNEGASVNGQNDRGHTALGLAAEHGDMALTRLLLRHGANPHLCDITGSKALDLAEYGGHTAVLRLLRGAGAQ